MSEASDRYLLSLLKQLGERVASLEKYSHPPMGTIDVTELIQRIERLEKRKRKAKK